MKKVYTSFLFILFTLQSLAQGICYVKQSAAAGGDGKSWATAFNSLDDALAAQQTDASITKIYITAGNYMPVVEAEPGSPGSKTFLIDHHLEILGGFPPDASGSMGPEAANPALYKTVLADLTSPDVQRPCHIITVLGNGLNVKLENLTIRSGYAGWRTPSADIYHSSGLMAMQTYGGGVYANGANLNLTRCLIGQNTASTGGAITAFNGTLTLDRDSFYLNSAVDYAAIYVANVQTTITNSIFSGNVATSQFSSYIISSSGQNQQQMRVYNCNFYRNQCNYAVLGGSPYELWNNIFIINRSLTQAAVPPIGSGNNQQSNLNITNDVSLSTHFQNLSKGFQLKKTAPGVNAGYAPAAINSTDYYGNARVTGIVDIGAAESPYPGSASITTFTTMDPLITNAATVRFRIMFTTAVSGVNTANFGVGGTASATVTAVENDQTDLRAWIVTVKPATEGTVGLQMTNDDGIDYIITSLTAADRGYTIDRTPPQLRTPVMGSSNTTTPSRFAKAGDMVSVTFNTNEPVSPAGGTISGINMSTTSTGNNYRAYVVVQNNTPEGLVVPDCSFADAAGNISKITSASFTAGVPITIDRTAPIVTVAPITVYPDELGKVTVQLTDLNISGTDNYTPQDQLIFDFTTTTLNWSANQGVINLNTTARDLAGNFRFTPVAVTFAKRIITSMDPFSPINVQWGTAPSNVTLPTAAKVTFNTGKIEYRSILWNRDDLQTKITGTHTITGSFPLNAYDDGSNTVTLTYTVGPKLIAGIAPVGNITKPYGTSLDGLNLSSTVIVNIVNQTNPEQVPVVWNTASYNPTQPGTYRLSGMLQLPQGYTNPNKYTAYVQVTVEKRYVTAYTATPLAEVPVGYSGLLNKPAQIAVTLSDGTATSYPVTWSGAADYNRIGSYDFTGSLQVDYPTDNTLGIVPTFTVHVVKRNMQTLETTTGATVAYGTAFSQLPLPATLYTIYNSDVKENVYINWQAGDYDATAPGTYTLYGDPVTDAISTNNLPLKGSINITVDKRYVTATATLPPMHVPYGSSAAALILPATVATTYSDHSTINTGITWNGNADLLTAGTYTYTGTLVTDNVSDNRNNIQVTQEVIVDRRHLTSIAPVADISVPFHTSFENIGLPATVQLHFDDQTALTTNVTWDGSSYLADQPGEYILQGSFTLDANTLNPNNLKLQTKVIVDKRYLTAITAAADITVPLSSDPADITLPANLSATFSDGTTAMVPVSWTGSTDTETAGTYHYQGIPVLDAVTDNRNNVLTSLRVVVKKRLVSVVHSPAAINVAYNTAFQQIGLPTAIQVDFDNGSTAQVPVSWQAGSYNPALPQTYTLTGSLQTDVNTDNAAGETARLQVTVEKRFITVIHQSADIHVALGSDPADIRLPATVDIIYSDGTAATAGINWAGNANTAQAGNYTYTGTVIMDAVTDNRNQVFAGMQVVVDKRNMTALAAINNITVPVGTSFGQLTLPTTVRISYDNGDHADANITWLPGNYDGNTAGTYPIYGIPVADANSANPQQLQATITITVSKLQQHLQYTAPGVIHEGDANYDLKAASSAGLPVSIQSGNTRVVSIQASQLHFEQPGKALITLTQAGNGTYEPASPVTFEVEVLAWPEAEISAGSSLAFCQGDRVVLSATPGAAYQWVHDGIAVPDAAVSTLEATASGTYQVQVTYANGFRKTSTPVMVTAHPLPTGTIAADNINISKGAAVQLQAGGGDSYSWTSTAPLSNSHIANPVSRPENDARYEVTITSAAGCSVKKDITVTVKHDFNLVATNILTPNGDGINDTWVIKNIDMYRQNELKIFDRSGRLLYTAKGYTNNWNGTVNGQPLAEGTYYYILEFENGQHQIKGFITIIR
ncbi:gliding motility-associated C-terminal domain-containing protein [Chitinophaga jiangningensis]|uniref:Gliding motility-associated C-terminal domain-containing protein n=1 Tax=Chitinophaga jiangningensis TaxID=1419482 RepID=A0A1M6Z6F3_9BACT|nr:Ig-like domain-containing protein [Chitinophaga jiangningensis]SHL25962.1 gliding motility-associated C-terminal domain-containing protein [Chitinophaga jiangningensis]